MRFAAIADVHGNYLALEAVLADIRALGIEDIVNLGDMASGPLDARRTMDMLMALDATHVLGNHDRYLIDRPPEKMGSWDRPAHAQLDAVSSRLVARGADDAPCFAIRSFSATQRLPTTKSTGSTPCIPMARSRCRRASGSSNSPQASAQSLILCATRHLARAVRLRDGRLIVNPGSVGSPGYRDVHPIRMSSRPARRTRATRSSNCRWSLAGDVPPRALRSRAMAALARRNGHDDLATAIATGWIK